MHPYCIYCMYIPPNMPMYFQCSPPEGRCLFIEFEVLLPNWSPVICLSINRNCFHFNVSTLKDSDYTSHDYKTSSSAASGELRRCLCDYLPSRIHTVLTRCARRVPTSVLCRFARTEHCIRRISVDTMVEEEQSKQIPHVDLGRTKTQTSSNLKMARD